MVHYAMPDPEAAGPHTLVFDPAGERLWFTVQSGNFVGRLRIATRDIDLIPVPTPNIRPYGIVTTPDGAPWVALFGTHKLAVVDPGALALSEVELPHSDGSWKRLHTRTAWSASIRCTRNSSPSPRCQVAPAQCGTWFTIAQRAACGSALARTLSVARLLSDCVIRRAGWRRAGPIASAHAERRSAARHAGYTRLPALK